MLILVLNLPLQRLAAILDLCVRGIYNSAHVRGRAATRHYFQITFIQRQFQMPRLIIINALHTGRKVT